MPCLKEYQFHNEPYFAKKARHTHTFRFNECQSCNGMRATHHAIRFVSHSTHSALERDRDKVKETKQPTVSAPISVLTLTPGYYQLLSMHMRNRTLPAIQPATGVGVVSIRNLQMIWRLRMAPFRCWQYPLNDSIPLVLAQGEERLRRLAAHAVRASRGCWTFTPAPRLRRAPRARSRCPTRGCPTPCCRAATRAHRRSRCPTRGGRSPR